MPHEIKQGDDRPILRVQLLNADGTPPDVTGATVTFRMSKAGVNRLVNGTVETIDGPEGIVEYRWEETESTAESGDFDAEFHVVFADGSKNTYPGDGYILVKVYTALT